MGPPLPTVLDGGDSADQVEILLKLSAVMLAALERRPRQACSAPDGASLNLG